MAGGLTRIDVFNRTRCIGESSLSIDFRSGVRVWVESLPDSEEPVDIPRRQSQLVVMQRGEGLLARDGAKRLDRMLRMGDKSCDHSLRQDHECRCACSPTNYSIQLFHPSILYSRTVRNLIDLIRVHRSSHGNYVLSAVRYSSLSAI